MPPPSTCISKQTSDLLLLPPQTQATLLMHLGKQQMMVQVFGTLLPTVETWTKLLALAWPGPIAAIHGVNQQRGQFDVTWSFKFERYLL